MHNVIWIAITEAYILEVTTILPSFYPKIQVHCLEFKNTFLNCRAQLTGQSGGMECSVDLANSRDHILTHISLHNLVLWEILVNY